ncbi:MAG: integrase/recombinase XerC [Actinobacteria bacterium]|nr:integrase/recombinase XerC [Actinomycetota bacterium]
MNEEFENLFNDFERHLNAERNLSNHTIRAYIGDLSSLLDHLEKLGLTNIAKLELSHLRSWLANQSVKGGARSTISRRAVSVRLFTKWAFKNKYLASDVGASLATPKGHRTLPGVLDINSATLAMDSLAARASDEESPLSLRGGLDIDDIDFNRNTIRVLGKGNKERTIPMGKPAVNALEVWLSKGREVLATELSAKAVFLGSRGGRIDQRTVRSVVYEALSAIVYLKVAPICEQCKKSWGMHPLQQRRFTLMFQRSVYTKYLRMRTHAREYFDSSYTYL